MPPEWEIPLTILGSVLASSGFWLLIQKKMDAKDAKTRMLIGLGHDKIIQLGLLYIARGYISADEYENLVDYLYAPYEALGGNGSAKKVIDEVKKLEIIG